MILVPSLNKANRSACLVCTTYCHKMGLKYKIVGTIVWTLSIIIFSVPLLFLFIWKLLAVVVAKCIRRDLVVLGTEDNFMAPGPGDVCSILNFGFVLQVQGELSLEDVRKIFTKKFLGCKEGNPTRKEYERFHYSLVSFMGHAFFKKLSEIDINELISIRHLNDKENESLEDLLSAWILTKYKENAPCWGIILVPMRATNHTAVAVKMHHALADGYSFLYILDQLTENSSPYLVKDFQDSCGQRVAQMLEIPRHFGKLKGDPEGNPFKILEERPPKWSMCFTRLDLETIKGIRRQHNVHFASIILTILAGALKRYLVEVMKVSDADLPPQLFMATTLPWPNHPSKNPNSDTNERICNRWLTALMKVSIGDENPLERLLQVEKVLTDFEDAGCSKFFKWIITPLMKIFPLSFAKGMAKDLGFAGGYSCTLGGNDYHLLGQKITSIHPIVALHDSNPFITNSAFAFTHSNCFDFTFSTHPRHFPDRQSLEKLVFHYLPEELEKLAAAKSD